MFAPQLAQWSARWLPSQCAVCHAWPAQPVCAACLARFAQAAIRCVRCAQRVPAGVMHCAACLAEPPPLQACVAAFDYAYPWSGIITRYKFNSMPGWAGTLAGLLQRTPGADAALARCELLIPMPLSPARLRERGFNQALELARHLQPGPAARAAALVQPGLLLRIRDTAPQSQLRRAQRLANVRGAFAIDPLRAQEVCGVRITLVDDVMTSGASLYAAARSLLQAGASEVSALVLARTPADDPGQQDG